MDPLEKEELQEKSRKQVKTIRTITVFITLIILAIAMLFALIIMKSKVTTFNGDRVKNPDCYTMDFTKMNGKDSHELQVEAGDRIKVDIDIESGNFDCSVTVDGEEIYNGNSIDSASFSLGVNSSGTCKISVKAKKAKGHANFYVQ